MISACVSTSIGDKEDFNMSNQEELLILHGQLLAGDMRVASKIVELVIAPLVATVTREVAGLHDRQDAEEACFDALFKYLEAPGNYDPQRAKLMTYLTAIAKGKAQTLRRAQTRRTKHEGEYAECQKAKNNSQTVAEGETAILHRVEWSRIRDRFGDKLIKDVGDAEVLNLMETGEDSLAAYARALGLSLDDEGMSEAGKRVERIRGRLRRIGERIGS
jgi:DNA-directed RNA polymerase specialized sigma24 family protein